MHRLDNQRYKLPESSILFAYQRTIGSESIRSILFFPFRYQEFPKHSPYDSACVDDAYVSLVLDGQVKYGAPMDCGCAFIGGVVNGKYWG